MSITILSLFRLKKPVLVQKFADQDITEGEKLELQIKVFASKPLTVTWYRDDEVIEADDRCKLLSDDDIHLLRVDPVEIDDEAIYKCVAKNQAGQDQCEAQILVEGTAVSHNVFLGNFLDTHLANAKDRENDATCGAKQGNWKPSPTLRNFSWDILNEFECYCLKE